jgi:hypothetical protein
MTTSSVPRNAPGDPSPDRTATHGIIGRPHDPQVASVAGRLRRRGIEPVVVDLSRFPGHGSLSVRDGVPTARNLDLRAVAAWYVRSFPLPLPFQVPHDIDPDASRLRYAAGRERRSFLAGFVAAMQASGALFVNPPVVMAQHFRKLEQLDTLRAAGVPVPATLATNDPRAVRKFARDVGGALVYKPLAGGGRCRRVTGDDLDLDRLRLLARAPVLFQAEIPGRNIRVYVVGGRVAAAYEIVSDQLDYRGAEIAVRPVPLGRASTCAAGRTAASPCWSATPRPCSPASNAGPGPRRSPMRWPTSSNAVRTPGPPRSAGRAQPLADHG